MGSIPQNAMVWATWKADGNRPVMLSEYFEQFSICSASDQLFMISVVTENGQVSEERSMTFPCPGNRREETRVSTVSVVLYLSYGLCPTRFLSWFQAARIHIGRAPFWAGNTFCRRPLGGVGCTNRFLFNFFSLSVVGTRGDEMWRPPAPHWGEKSYRRNKPTAHIPSEKPPAANPAWSLQAKVGAERETSFPLFALVGSSLLKPWLLLSFLPFIVSSGKPRASEAAFHPHRRF